MSLVVRSKRLLLFLVLLIGLLIPAWESGLAEGQNQAGLVILHGDGSHSTHCVSFPEAQITGQELLERSGLDVELAIIPGSGAALCRLEVDGCPVNDCFCQSPPDYWSYWHLADGSWVYSQIGMGASTITPGSVDGWVWGPGDSSPPVIPFNEICVPPTSTPTETAPPTETPLDTATPTATFTSEPSATPEPTATNKPAQAPTITPSSTDTQVPAATETPLPTQTRAPDTVVPSPTQTETVLPTETTVPSATATSMATETPTMTPSPVPSVTPTQTDTVSPFQAPTPTPETQAGSMDMVGVMGVGIFLLFLVLLVGGILFTLWMLRGPA